MLTYLVLICLVMSFIFMAVKHPLSLGFILLAQTMISTLLLGFVNFDLWFSFMLFLVMMGGMLVLFVYMTSIASNEKFSFSKLIPLLMFSLIKSFILIVFLDNYLQSYMEFHKNILNYPIFTEIQHTMSKFFNSPGMIILIMLVLYLLLTLIIVVSMTKIKQGPLRPKN